VDRALEYLATDPHGRAALWAAFQRSGRYEEGVERVLRAWKLPAQLSAIALVESAFSPSAGTPSGEAGVFALPLDVARVYGLIVQDQYDERRSVPFATEAAAHYLADLHERLGSWELSLYAFGQGYAVAREAIEKRPTADYWELAGELAPEGTAYVARVLAVATILANPDRFGLDTVRRDDAEIVSELEVPAGTDLSLVARAAGTSVVRLKELNPEYLGEVVPSTGGAMAVHVPSAGLARAKELLMPLLYSTSARERRGASFDWGARPAEASTRPEGHAGPSAFWRVQEGDTLESLARRFAVAREEIASDNALDPSAGLRAGQLLRIHPVPRNGAASARPSRDPRDLRSSPGVADASF
jgi:membrane-bound lytic murein transglycosylase D